MTKEEVVMKIPANPSRATAIHDYCLQCGDGTFTELRDCNITACPLFPFRFGTSPATAISRLEKTYTVKVVK
jgi:hypothetical protein